MHNLTSNNRRFDRNGWTTAMVAVLFSVAFEAGFAQVEMRVVRGGITQAPTISEDDHDQATIKTDADLESLLSKAKKYLEDGNYRIACRIWQEVLNRCGDTLFSEDNEVYYSLAQEVERMIAQLPAEGLQTYRISADASATEILAASNDQRSVALNRVVDEFFLSSLGDDAAYELACLNLDSFDYVGAGRLLQRIVDDYPDPTVPLDEIWARLAVCQALSRNFAAAESAIDAARALPRHNQSLVDRVAAQVATLAQRDAIDGTPAWQKRSNDWDRLTPMPDLPPGSLSVDLRPVFHYKIPAQHQLRGSANDLAVYGASNVGEGAGALPAEEAEKSMWDRWRKESLIPAGKLLFHDDYVYYKTAVDMSVWNRRNPVEQVVWRPAWLNQFEIDDATKTRNMLQQAYGGRRRGSGGEMPVETDIYFFGDRIAHAATIYRGVLYMVEGPNYDISDKSPPTQDRNEFQWGRAPRRTRTNFLTAYDAESGLLQWRMPPLPVVESTASTAPPPAGESPDPIEEVGFMGPPVGFADLLLCPVNVGGAIYVYALDANRQGAVLWQAYLTDEPIRGTNPWSPIQMFLDGSDLYVVCGSGALFVLNPSSGIVRFARRYQRTGPSDISLRELGVTTDLRKPDGFVEDMAIPYGKAVLVLASDLNVIRAYDRSDGRFLWEAPTSTEGDAKVDYVIGIHNDRLYCGGSREIVAYDLKGDGRMLWTASWSARDVIKSRPITGRCCLTANAIYVPLDDSVVQLDLGNGSAVAQAGVGLGERVPLGNLYSDGQRLWSLSANRLLAFEPVIAETSNEATDHRTEIVTVNDSSDHDATDD